MQDDHRWERNWRRIEEMARRSMRGFPNVGSWANFDGFGENIRIGRMLASGDVRLVSLYLIEQQPRHGYDLIKAIEERSGGFYAPSPGVVYPALTFLEEAGYVTSAADGNKKLYTITDSGRSHLADNRTAIESTLNFLTKAGEKMNSFREKMRSEDFSFAFGDRDGPPPRHPEGPREQRWEQHVHETPRPDRDMTGVVPELNEARRTLKSALAEMAQLDEERQRRAAEILNKAARKLRNLKDDEIDL
jgi:DNA-binding PadR family transcriptional regulator